MQSQKTVVPVLKFLNKIEITSLMFIIGIVFHQFPEAIFIIIKRQTDSAFRKPTVHINISGFSQAVFMPLQCVNFLWLTFQIQGIADFHLIDSRFIKGFIAPEFRIQTARKLPMSMDSTSAPALKTMKPEVWAAINPMQQLNQIQFTPMVRNNPASFFPPLKTGSSRQ